MRDILLIEDERQFARFVELELLHEGFNATCAYDGESGLRLALAQEWDLILLDVMLPGIGGIDLCRMIKMRSRTPVIMITARDAVEDRVQGLSSGADDYVPKPFAMKELLARMRAIFRRTDQQEQPSGVMTYRNIVLNKNAMTVAVGEREIELSKREFDLLELLILRQGEVLSRDRILDELWGVESEVEANIVDVYIGYLRQKLRSDGEHGIIRTVRGAGYMLE
jgi:DNA-binding response OmpR family regulator